MPGRAEAVAGVGGSLPLLGVRVEIRRCLRERNDSRTLEPKEQQEERPWVGVRAKGNEGHEVRSDRREQRKSNACGGHGISAGRPNQRDASCSPPELEAAKAGHGKYPVQAPNDVLCAGA